MSNGSGINWTSIVMGVILFVVGLFIPSPFQSTSPDIRIGPMDSTVVVVRGIPDTSVSVGKTYKGTTSDTIYIATLPDIPIYVEIEVDTVLAGGTKVYIRSTNYLHKIRDKEGEESLLVIPTIEWNITERPVRNIIRIDTTKTYYPVEIKYEPSWFNKPEIVVPTTALLTVVAILLLVFSNNE